MLALPEHFPISRNQKYRELNIEANQSLNLYVEKKLFEHWKKNHLKIRAFKKKLYLKKLKKHFKLLEKNATRKIIKRHKIENYIQNKAKQKLTVIFARWSKLTSHKKYLQLKYQTEIKKKQKKSIIKFLHVWLKKTRELTTEAVKLSTAEYFHSAIALRKTFMILQRHSIFCQKVKYFAKNE